MINNLLSIRGNNQSNASPSCEKHDGEILKLFCQTCDQLICRDCAIIDHRDHKYTFVKEIFPAVKEEIEDIVKKSRRYILALESSIETIKKQEDDMHKNYMEVHRELDSFIDEQIELLERKRQSVKDDLQNSISAQKKNLDAQMESFQTSLGSLKSSVEFTEEALTRGSEVEILSAKNQMIQQLTELNLASSYLKPRGRIYYRLEPDSLFNNDMLVEKMAKIGEYDKEYELVRRNKFYNSDQPMEFIIRPKSKSNTFALANEVQVIINERNSNKVFLPDITKKSGGSFHFNDRQVELGISTIEVIVNGRYIHGSPFAFDDIRCAYMYLDFDFLTAAVFEETFQVFSRLLHLP